MLATMHHLDMETNFLGSVEAEKRSFAVNWFHRNFCIFWMRMFVQTSPQWRAWHASLSSRCYLRSFRQLLFKIHPKTERTSELLGEILNKEINKMINQKTLFVFLSQSQEASENKRGKELDNNNCWNKRNLLGKAAWAETRKKAEKWSSFKSKFQFFSKIASTKTCETLNFMKVFDTDI